MRRGHGGERGKVSTVIVQVVMWYKVIIASVTSSRGRGRDGGKGRGKGRNWSEREPTVRTEGIGNEGKEGEEGRERER